MSLTFKEKKRIIALARQSIAPDNGIEKHFVKVVQGNGIACTHLEKECLLFWNDYQREPYGQGLDLDDLLQATEPTPLVPKSKFGTETLTKIGKGKSKPKPKPKFVNVSWSWTPDKVPAKYSGKAKGKRCSRCGCLIPRERLKISPKATRCVGCQQKAEVKRPKFG